MNQYFVGQELELSTVFTNDQGEPVDPETVTCKVLRPDGAIDEPTPIQHTASGTFVVNYTPALIGLHEYRFAGFVDAEPVSAGEKTFLTTTDFGTGG